MRFIDMFAGIGGFRSGLEKTGHQCVGYVEWDKYARKSYQAIYNTEGEYTKHDIKEVKGIELPDADIWTFGSPCQDISIAGNQKGLVKGGEEAPCSLRLSDALKSELGGEKTLPTILIMENVKALLSSNGGWDFARVLIEMDQVGYDAEWAVLNSSDVVPQNRERVYIIGHLRGTSTRQVFPIHRKSRDITSTKIVYESTVNNPKHRSGIVVSSKGVTPTLTATDYKHPCKVAVKQVGNIVKSSSFGGNPQRGRVYSTDGLAPTLNTMQGGGLEPKVLTKRPLKGCTTNGWHFEQNCFDETGIAATLKAGGGSDNIPKIVCKPCLTPDRINKRQDGRRFKEKDEPEFTLTGQDKHGVLIEDDKSISIRKLTPRECWRLQGFTDEQFDRAKAAGVSDSQLYKQAGNAVTVDVVEQIGKRLNLSGEN